MECKLADVQLYLTDDDIDGDAKHISEEVSFEPLSMSLKR